MSNALVGLTKEVFCMLANEFRGLPTDEDLIAVGTNTKMSRPRYLHKIEEVKTAAKQ
ncbi:MAG: hypothetical protein IKG81_03045 [Bacteroidales bacterium]|nr:hypothetical protein [Bacteroidales bacterium]